MIPCSPGAEPPTFDERVRKRGAEWLKNNPRPPKKPGTCWRPYDYWSEFRSELADAFKQLCAYGAMYEPNGTVDHFTSCDTDENLAYEWNNYRFVTQVINSSKKNADNLLDPCDVCDGWFEVQIPSMQLIITDKVPQDKRAVAEYTVKRLKLNGRTMKRQRASWYEEHQHFQNKADALGLLSRKAPLIARAIENQVLPNAQVGT